MRVCWLPVPPTVSLGVALVIVVGLFLIRPAPGSGSPVAVGELARIRRMLCGIGQAVLRVYVGTFVFLGFPRWVLAEWH